MEQLTVEQHFRNAMNNFGLTPPEEIHADGQIHVWREGWYSLFPSPPAASGSFGGWAAKNQKSAIWVAVKPGCLTRGIIDAVKQRIELQRSQVAALEKEGVQNG